MRTDKQSYQFDEEELKFYLIKEPWVMEIANKKEKTWEDIEEIVERFICEYWMMKPEEVSTWDVAQVLWTAKNLSKEIRYIL